LVGVCASADLAELAEELLVAQWVGGVALSAEPQETAPGVLSPVQEEPR